MDVRLHPSETPSLCHGIGDNSRHMSRVGCLPATTSACRVQGLLVPCTCQSLFPFYNQSNAAARPDLHARRRRLKHWPDWPPGRHRASGHHREHRPHWEHWAHRPNVTYWAVGRCCGLWLSATADRLISMKACCSLIFEMYEAALPVVLCCLWLGDASSDIGIRCAVSLKIPCMTGIQGLVSLSAVCSVSGSLTDDLGARFI